MDAPPPQEDVGAFHRVENLLLSLGLSAPRPLAVDRADGLMLLEDLGDRTFTRALAEGADERALYELAVDVLIHLHRAADASALAAEPLPDYDDGRLLQEARDAGAGARRLYRGLAGGLPADPAYPGDAGAARLSRG